MRDEKSMPEEYASHFQDQAVARDYAAKVYGEGTFDSHVSQLQLAWVRSELESRFEAPPIHLDFACGTGRILAALEDVTPESYGFDVSAEMLELAEERHLRATLLKTDPMAPTLSLPATGSRPVAVTMFRFLLNAEPAARTVAMEFAAEALTGSADSLLIVNNHGNRTSLRELARLKPRRRGPWFNSMSDRDVRDLLAAHGLSVVSRYGVGAAPSSTYRNPRLRPIAEAVTNRLAGEGPTGLVGADITYVAKLRETGGS
jgi:SAM-dependent methyltransferase